jgi:hypothetical protein
MTVPNAESWHTTTVASSRQTMSRAVIKVSLFHMHVYRTRLMCVSVFFLYLLSVEFPLQSALLSMFRILCRISCVIK